MSKKALSRLIRPNKDRANTIITVFSIMLFLHFASGINYLLFYNKFSGASFGQLQEVKDSQHLVLVMVFVVLNFILVILAIITFLNWFRRAYYNLHVFSIKKLDYDEDMAVWGFMIPFLNLFRPYTIAKEIYSGNHSKAKELSNKDLPINESIIEIWWFLFIALAILSSLIGNKGGAETLEQLVVRTSYLSLISFLEIPRLIAAIFMVKTISKLETIVYVKRLSLDHNDPMTHFSEEE